MAKGARASTVKRNNANLRAKIFGPAADERTARLSAKLQELVSKARADEARVMDVDASQETEHNPLEAIAQISNNMDLDQQQPPTKHKSSSKKRSAKIEKKLSKKKPRNRVTFPASAAKRKRIAQSKKKSV